MPFSTTVRIDRGERHRRTAAEPALAITKSGVAFGDRVLARMDRGDDGPPKFAINGGEDRILALLAAVYGKSVCAGVLDNIRRASTYWCQGEPVLAEIELALAGLPPLADPAAARRRLDLAETLLAAGLPARDLIEACGLDPLDLLKAGYDPSQPRVPAGNPTGGRWADGDAAGNGSSTPPRDEPSTAATGPSTRRVATLHGFATVYTNALRGRPTATGDAYDPRKMTAAVLPGTIPLKSVVTVTLDSDPTRSVDVYVNDHGLYQRILEPDGTYSNRPLPGRVIDLSSAAFKALTGIDSGKVMVTVTVKSAPTK